MQSILVLHGLVLLYAVRCNILKKEDKMRSGVVHDEILSKDR